MGRKSRIRAKCLTSADVDWHWELVNDRHPTPSSKHPFHYWFIHSHNKGLARIELEELT